MKTKISILLAALILLITPTVSARWHRTQSPPPVIISTTDKIYGVNYGHNFAGHTYDPVQAGKDLDELKAAGVKAIRIYVGTSGTGEVDFTKQLAILAKNKGMLVTWGVCTGGSVNSSSDWNIYLARLDSYAAWANSNGIDFFTIGNEEEFIPLPSTTIANGIRSSAAHIKTLYPNLKLTYAAAAYPDLVTSWLADTGQLDTIGFNVYVDFANITNQLKQNPKAIITEWNTDEGINAVSGSESKWATELVKDRDIINASGVKAYLFVIRGNGGGINNDWSMWIGGTRRQAWQALLK